VDFVDDTIRTVLELDDTGDILPASSAEMCGASRATSETCFKSAA